MDLESVYERLCAKTDIALYQTLESFKKEILDPNNIFFEHEGASILLKAKTYPTGYKELEGLYAVGDFSNLSEIHAKINQVAKENSCNGISIPCGRRGWAKALPDYNVASTKIRKIL